MNSVFFLKSAAYKTIVLLFFLSLVSGCSVYKSKSECPAGKGASCQSTSKVNELINNNELENFIEQQNCKGKACKNSRIFVTSKEKETDSTWMRVYINSYIDDSGIKHEPHVLEFKIPNK